VHLVGTSVLEYYYDAWTHVYKIYVKESYSNGELAVTSVFFFQIRDILFTLG